MADFRLDIDYNNDSNLQKENMNEFNEQTIIDETGKNDGMENINVMNIAATNLGNLSLDDIRRGSPVTRVSSGSKCKNISIIELLDDSDCSNESSLGNQNEENIMKPMIEQNISILSVHSDNDGNIYSGHDTKETSPNKNKETFVQHVKANTTCLDTALNDDDDDDFSSSRNHSIDSSISLQKRDDSILSKNVNDYFSMMNNPLTVLSDTELSEKSPTSSPTNFTNYKNEHSKDRNKRKYICEKIEHAIIDLCDSPIS